MAKKEIVEFPVKLTEEYRRRFSFKNKNTEVRGEEGGKDTFPCIVLEDTENKIPVAYTGYERFINDLQKTDVLKGSTLSKQATFVCHFLNYLLKEARIDRICDISLNDIRKYAIYSKKKDENEECNPNTFFTRLYVVIHFLKNYYYAYNGRYKFNYKVDEIIELQVVKDIETNRKYEIEKNKGLHVSGPRKTHKKNRFLVEGYLKLIIYEARKYDPMLALAIAIQAYAGLREGEVMNLTCGRVIIKKGEFNSIKEIELDITDKAPFWDDYKGKTPPAEFKEARSRSQKRVQKVYYDFTKEVEKMYDEHIAMLHAKGYGTGKDDPLFVNMHGNPMTRQTYCRRVKELFQNRFIPSLKRLCIEQNTLAENAAYIEAYEEDYLGAHMFRHWFTMYLITRGKRSDGHAFDDEDLSYWRHDRNTDSAISYKHDNDEFIKKYKSNAFRLQLRILEDIEKLERE